MRHRLLGWCGLCQVDAIKQAGGVVVAVVFECTELPPYSNKVREQVNVPVYDSHTMMNWLAAGRGLGTYSAFM